MRINNAYNFRPQGVEKKDSSGKSGKSSKTGSKGQVAKSDPESLVISEAKPFLDKIQALPEVRTDAVQAARKALEDGELDSPDAARRAAENIVDLGY